MDDEYGLKSGMAHRALFAAALLYAVTRGVIDHVVGRPNLAVRAENARRDLEQRRMNAIIDDLSGSVAAHLIWAGRMAGAGGWDAYAGRGSPYRGVPLALPYALSSGRMPLDPDAANRAEAHEEHHRLMQARHSLGHALARGHGAHASGVMGPSKRDPLSHADVEAVRRMGESGPEAAIPGPQGLYGAGPGQGAVRDTKEGLTVESWPGGWTRLERDIERGWVVHHMTEGGMRIWRRAGRG